MGKLYQTPPFPVEQDQVTSNYSIWRPNSFPHAAKESRLWSEQRQLQMPLQIRAPPIAFPHPSTNQGLVSSTNHNPTYCCSLCSDLSPPPPTFEKQWEHGPTKQISVLRWNNEKCGSLTHLIVRFIVHFCVGESERWIGATGEAWILPRFCPRPPKSNGTFWRCRFMVFGGDGSSGVAAERVGEASLGAESQAPASRWLTNPKLSQRKCLPCKVSKQHSR